MIPSIKNIPSIFVLSDTVSTKYVKSGSKQFKKTDPVVGVERHEKLMRTSFSSTDVTVWEQRIAIVSKPNTHDVHKATDCTVAELYFT